MRRTPSGRWLGMLPVAALALAVGGAPPTTDVAGQSAAQLPPQQLATHPFEVAEGPLPEFDGPVDVVIPAEQLDEYLAASEADPERYEGWDVGVVPADDVSREEQAVVDGGDAAAAIDEENLNEARRSVPQQRTAPSCPEDDPASDNVGVYLACRGHEPRPVFRARPELDSLERGELLEAAVRELASDAPVTESAAGLYSVVADVDDPVRSVTVEGSTAVVDLSVAAADLGLDTAFVRIVLVHQFVATATQFDGVDALQFRLEGSCEEFAAAVGGEECVTYRPEDLEVTE